MSPTNALRARTRIAALLALCLAAAACGQLPDVHLEGGNRTGGGGGGLAADEGFEGGEPGEFDDVEFEDGEFGDDVALEEGAEGAEAAGGGGGGDGAGGDEAGDSGGSGGGEGAQQQGRRQVRGSDRTGVSEDTIRLGSHAPVTGAAPLPSRAFQESADLYWRWVIEAQGQKVLGRTKIDLTFADDRYQPSTATQVCRQLAQNSFALAGAGGTDQIQACARFANNARVPYSSVGVTERGLENLDWYFAFSMTYRAQGELLGQYVAKNFSGKKVGAVVTDTPNFDDAVQGWERGVQRNNLNAHKTIRHPRGDTSWYNTVARELAQAGVEVLYINSSPVDYIRFAQQAHQQGYRPQFVGVGVTMGLNAVLGSGCDQVDGGIFFSPFPGLDWAEQNEPEFFQAARQFNIAVEDLSFAIWGQSKAVHQSFKNYEREYGTDLTREDFREFMERQQVRSGVFPDVQYAPDNHFGARQVHVLRANCAKEQYETLETFKSSF